MPPLIGITTDIDRSRTPERAFASLTYARAIAGAGGTPILLPPLVDCLDLHLEACDAFVLTGGDDPRTEPFGVPTHAKATPIDPDRQDYETSLLQRLHATAPTVPVLGVCLGMQMMALVAGGSLDQHMPETTPTAPSHWARNHRIIPASSSAPFPAGEVHSKHRQAVSNPGRLQVLAHAPDGIIEALADPTKRFYIGVQWHPERTDDPALGLALFKSLCDTAR